MTDHNDELFCPVYQHAVELIGGRWTGSIVRAMLGGLYRFSDLAASIPGLSDRMLSDRLRELESEGIVTRIVVPDVPVRVEYRLTDKGRALSGVIESIVTWLEDWTEEPAQALRVSGAAPG
jgi:DNA-binding HxlR family transcriptional regulator